MTETKKILLIGFSGGADSCALLIKTLTQPRWNNYEKHALYCHHHLRDHADKEVEFCRIFSEDRGIVFHLEHLDLQTDKNIESQARQKRFEAYEKCLFQLTNGDYSKAVLLLGHHLDDKLENLFLRLMRGSNLSGLLAPREVNHTAKGYAIIRPLLHFTKQNLIDFLKENKIKKWMEDDTNAVDFCARNMIRNQIISPLKKRYKHAYEGMCQSLEVLGVDCDFIESQAMQIFCEISTQKTHINRQKYAQLHSALQIRILRYFLETNHICTIPNRALLNRLQEIISREHIQEPLKISLDSENFLYVSEQSISIL